MRQKIMAATAAAAFAYCVPALLAPSVADAQAGLASYYKSGKLTANGERFNPHGLTAAHRSLPFGTTVRVTQVKSGRSVVVRINDRGPFIGGRIIDLSLGAAKVIGLHSSGIASVRVDVLAMGKGRARTATKVKSRSGKATNAVVSTATHRRARTVTLAANAPQPRTKTGLSKGTQDSSR
jgi:rare lipoprotein A